jgi:hypothetical protein
VFVLLGCVWHPAHLRGHPMYAKTHSSTSKTFMKIFNPLKINNLGCIYFLIKIAPKRKPSQNDRVSFHFERVFFAGGVFSTADSAQLKIK